MHPLRLRLWQLWNTYKLQRYRPVTPTEVDHEALILDIAAALERKPADIRSLWRDYRALTERENHSGKLGAAGSTSREEVFLIHCLLEQFAPASLIEIGTYEGGATRRVLDSIADLGLPTRVTTYDIVNLVKHFRPDEADFRLQDLTHTFERDVLDKFPPGLIYLDAHPWQLLQNVLRGALGRDDWILVIHDCSPVLCNPRITIPKDEPRLISARTGHWERHALADVFGLRDPLDPALDQLETTAWRLRVFGTQHGIALLIPKRLTALNRRDSAG